MAPSIGTTDIHPVGWLAQIFSSTEQTTGWRVARFSRRRWNVPGLFRRQSHPTGTGVKADLVRTGRTLPLAEPCVASVVRGVNAGLICAISYVDPELESKGLL